jgi:hypothetical protein
MKLPSAGYPVGGYPSLHVFGGWTAKPFEKRPVTLLRRRRTISGSLPQRGVTGCNRRPGNHGQPEVADWDGGPRSDDPFVQIFVRLPRETGEIAVIRRAARWKRQSRRARIARRSRVLDLIDSLIGRPPRFQESES